MDIALFRILVLNAVLWGAVLSEALTPRRAIAPVDHSVASPHSGELSIAQATQSFSDVPSDFWASEYIHRLAAQGIIASDANGNFRPDDPMTRVDYAMLISKAFSQSPVQEPTDFSDVPNSYWGYQFIMKAKTMGFLNEYGNRQFRPDQNISRFDVLLSLVKGLRYKPKQPYTETVSIYQDGYKIPVWMIETIGAATEQGLIVNYPDPQQLNFKQAATRAEVAAMVYQTLSNIGAVPKIESEYVVTFQQGVQGNATNYSEENCSDVAVQNYITELREFKESHLLFKPIAYQNLLKCGQNSVAPLIRELGFVKSGEYSSELDAVILACIAQIGQDAVPALASIIQDPTSVYENISDDSAIGTRDKSRIYSGEQIGAIYALEAIGPKASEAIPLMISLLENEEYGSNLLSGTLSAMGQASVNPLIR